MLLPRFAPAPIARRRHFRWEYINPANPSLGKQPSSTLGPDGAGGMPCPARTHPSSELTKAYLIGADLHQREHLRHPALHPTRSSARPPSPMRILVTPTLTNRRKKTEVRPILRMPSFYILKGHANLKCEI